MVVASFDVIGWLGDVVAILVGDFVVSSSGGSGRFSGTAGGGGGMGSPGGRAIGTGTMYACSDEQLVGSIEMQDLAKISCGLSQEFNYLRACSIAVRGTDGKTHLSNTTNHLVEPVKDNVGTA